MTDLRVARRYATALFRTAKANGIVEAVEQDLIGIGGIIETDAGFRRYLHDPTVATTDKQGLLDRVLSDRVTALTLQVVRMMLEKGREGEFLSVREEFVRLRRDSEKIVHITVTSTEVLDENQKRPLIDKLTKTLGRTLEVDYQVDASLIGGITVAYENFVLDGSLRGSLDRLREQIYHNALKQAF
jgi:F-type H+-transporting ATPase subunit delta